MLEESLALYGRITSQATLNSAKLEQKKARSTRHN